MKKQKKLRVGVLFGGRSGEHEVSLLSAASILSAIDPKKYDVVPIGITKQGRWITASSAQDLLLGRGQTEAATSAGSRSKAEILHREQSPDAPTSPLENVNPFALSATGTSALALDVVFPVLHGTFGEDGTIQGLLELADIAYVGSGVLGSAAGMDKAAMKQLFAAAGLPQTPYVALLRSEWKTDPKRVVKQVENQLNYPLFVKPANLGSSVGISKVHDRRELAPALNLAARFERRRVVEQGVGGAGAKPRELEVAVLGNDRPEASVVGEIVPGAEFYDYNAKYHSDASVPIIPAKLSRSEEKQIRAMAIAAFRTCDCAGLARVDFLMEPGSSQKEPDRARIFLNEINTMPGFTSISMYPKLWDASGVSYRELIDRLIALALERQAERRQTNFSHS